MIPENFEKILHLYEDDEENYCHVNGPGMYTSPHAFKLICPLIEAM